MIGGTRTIVLDDDPTGTQSAAGVTVLFDHDVDSLVSVLEREPSVYLQTNSRALDERAAVALATGIRAAALEAANRLGVGVRFVLRGDSTLRGHVFSESAVFMADDAVLLFVPAFPDGGRETRGGIHFVRQGGELVPVAETEFAADPVFGFAESDLVAFAGVRSERSATLVHLTELRSGGLVDALLSAPAGGVVLSDAVSNDDIRLIALAVELAWSTRPVVVRSAAPLAAELAGVSSDGLLDSSAVVPGRVLVVCGSHTDGARRQLDALAELIGPPSVIDTALALVDAQAEGRRVAAVEAAIRRPRDARFVATERHRSSDHGTLDDGARVMAALVAATRELAGSADVVVTKGGITSAEVVRSGLGASRARVLGQVQAGVSVWLVAMAGGRSIPIIIVPGNMGGPDALVAAVSRV